MRHVVYRYLIAVLPVLPAAARINVPRPAFEAATVKPNPNCAGGRGGGRGVPPTGRLNVTCLTACDLIQIAYGMFADGLKQSPHRPQVFNGPAWIDSETFDIVAKAEDNAPVARMYGPMMQSLLEDRFALKIHKETRQLPVYALTIAKNGAKLLATPETSCATNPCGRGSVRTANGNTVIEGHAVTLAVFAERLVETLNQPVIDRTGLTRLFDIHLEFAPYNAGAEKGPVEALVIDPHRKTIAKLI
jgi:uncharacterized protein (TIGR03435 family)